MSLQELFQKAAMDDSYASKRGDVMDSSGDSPSKRQRGGAPLLEGGRGRSSGSRGGKSGGRNGGNRGRGRGGQPKGKGGYQPSGDSGQKTTALVSAMARLIIRHDEQILALSLDVSFVSYARTDQHSVLPQLFAESRRLKSTLSAMPPKQAMAIRFFRELKDCLIGLRGGGMALPGGVCGKSIND